MAAEPVTLTAVIPTHNRVETVVHSVASALRQTRSPVEVIVVADGCTDATAETLTALGDERVVVLDLPKGPAYGYGNRNEALRRARGDVVAWLADDDIWLPDHLEQVGALFDAGGVDLVQVPAVAVDSEGELWWQAIDWRVPRLRRLLDEGRGTPMSCISHRVEVALKVGGWRDDRPRGGDRDLWSRILDGGARPAMTALPSAIWLGSAQREEAGVDRGQESRRYLELTAGPTGLARFRSEVALSAGREMGAREVEVHELYVSRDEAWAALARAQEEVQRLHVELARARAGRPRARLRRLASAVRRRAGSSRMG